MIQPCARSAAKFGSSVIETLEDWQMGKIAGDAYNMREMMVVDGLGTCIGALFGSFLPTTVYLGHPIHKARV